MAVGTAAVGLRFSRFWLRLSAWSTLTRLASHCSPFVASAGQLRVYLLCDPEPSHVGVLLARWHRALAVHLDSYFGCGHTFEVSQMLSVEQPDDIALLLDDMRVPAAVLGDRDRRLGQPLPDAAWVVPGSNAPEYSLDPSLQELVAVGSVDEGFWFGLLLKDRGALLDVDGGLQHKLVTLSRAKVWTAERASARLGLC